MEISNQSDTSNSPDYSSAQKLIDQEISQLYESIRALRSRRNELSPVSRLPPEVVYEIFQFYRKVTPRVPNPHKWVTITHVSKRWMEIALNSPSLWSEVVISKCSKWPQWETELFVRTKNSPFSVEQIGFYNLSRYSSSRSLTHIRLVLGQLYRVTQLSLQFHDQVALVKLLPDMQLPSPLLSSLTFEAQYQPYSTDGPDSAFITICDKVFTDCISLRSLSLTKCMVNYESPIFRASSLVTLSLAYIPDAYRPSVTQILHLLRNFDCLKDLDLYDAFSIAADDVATAEQISLPQLTWFCFTGTVKEAAMIVSHILYPDHATIALTCRWSDLSEAEYSILMSIFNSPIPRLCFRCLDLRGDGSTWLTMKGRSKICYAGRLDFVREIIITSYISRREESGQRYFESLMSQACRRQLENLEELTLSDGVVMSAQMWIEVFGGSRKLQKICLVGQGPSLIGLLEVMNPSASPSGNGDVVATLPFLPSLTSMDVYKICFKLQPSPLELMEKSFTKRREQGVPIHELSLHCCVRIEPGDVEKLRLVVGQVHWDGKIHDSFDCLPW